VYGYTPLFNKFRYIFGGRGTVVYDLGPIVVRRDYAIRAQNLPRWCSGDGIYKVYLARLLIRREAFCHEAAEFFFQRRGGG